MSNETSESSDSGVRQDSPQSHDQSEQGNGGKLAQFWAFRFTASKCETGAILDSFEVPWVKGYGFQMERGKKRSRVEHYQGTVEVWPRKRFKQLESHLRENISEDLVFDGRDYLGPSKSEAANAYGLKEDTRVDGPWVKGERYEIIAKETVYRVDIILYNWQKRICAILDAPPNGRDIWWFWEPKGGAGKTTFLKWVEQNYKNVCISGGKAADMKNGIVRHREGTGSYPKIVLINIPMSFELQYFSAAGTEEVKDMFFFSGKYGGKDENGQVNARPPTMIIMANEEPPLGNMASDRWKIIRLPDGKGRDGTVFRETWEE